MELDNLSLAYLILENRPFVEGAFVNKVSEISSGTLKLKLHTKHGSKDLILSPSCFFISDYSVAARHGKTNFAMALRKELYNKRITGLLQHGFDRVVVVKMLEHSLVLEFIGDGNEVLVGKDGRIISCLRNEEWSDRKLRKGEVYAFPRQRGVSPLEVGESYLHDAFLKSGKQAFQALLGAVSVSPIAAEEVFHSLGIDKARKASSLSIADVARVALKVRELYTVLPEKLKPVAYSGFCYPFRLENVKEEPRPIPSLNSFVSESLLRQGAHGPVPVAGGAGRQGKVSKLEFQRGRQAEARVKFESLARENAEKAEAVWLHYAELEELRNAISAAARNGFSEVEIMARISQEARKGNAVARLLKRVDLKAKRFEVEL